MRIGLLAVCISLSLLAQAQMPTLKVADDIKTNPVILEQLAIDVTITGNIATTNMTLTFKNNGSRVLEGELTFPMPEGVTVSRYALDINGKMREAVPVSKARATEVFESIEHRNIDPGLLEKVEGNNFRTRIFPFPVGGTRTISISYEEELKLNTNHALQYYLPFNYTQAIPQFSLKATVFASKEKPQLAEQPDGSFSFNNAGNAYIATLNKENYKPVKSLTINLPKQVDAFESMVQSNTDGSAYFLINDFPRTESRIRQWGNSIAVLWDVSLSGAKRDHKKELELLDKIIQQKQNLTIALTLLNTQMKYEGSYKISNGNWSELRKKLEGLTYDGATDYSAVQLPIFADKMLISALDEILFFTDGMSTFGDNDINIDRPVHTITTNAVTDYSTLKYISQKTGGQFINLSNQTAAQAFEELGKEYMQFLGVEGSGISEVYPDVKVPVVHAISVAGLIDNPDEEITLLYGWGNKITLRKKIKLDAVANDINVHKIWAQKKIATMDVNYEKNKDDLLALGQQFGIVTRNTSLMVLENVTDYVRYDITPPTELMAEFDRLKKQNLAIKEQRVNDLLERAAEMATDLKEWWKKDFTQVKTKKFPTPRLADSNSAEDAAIVPPPPPPATPRIDHTYNTESDETKVAGDQGSPGASSNLQGRAAGINAQNKMEEVVVVGYGVRKKSSLTGSSTTITKSSQTITPTPDIKIPTFKSDKDYIKKLETANKHNIYATYLQLRDQYETTPSFYFDVANWFYDNNNPDTANLILSNIVELSIEDASLYKMIAYKLKQLGNYKKELWVAKKVKEWRPMDPQSTRDYALALEDNGKYQDALDALYSILKGSYSPEAANRDEGIEEILVMEINKLVALHRNQLNISKIDKRIIANLPVDIRVVLNWNKADVDIDLWVTSPDGEKCYYSNNRTAIGGRISNDFTAGFGPEQFLLKKAIRGKYKIETNFFGERQLSISGPTTLMAEIYLYYANGKQTRKIITLQSGEKGKEADGVLVGEFKF